MRATGVAQREINARARACARISVPRTNAGRRRAATRPSPDRLRGCALTTTRARRQWAARGPRRPRAAGVAPPTRCPCPSGHVMCPLRRTAATSSTVIRPPMGARPRRRPRGTPQATRRRRLGRRATDRGLPKCPLRMRRPMVAAPRVAMVAAMMMVLVRSEPRACELGSVCADPAGAAAYAYASPVAAAVAAPSPPSARAASYPGSASSYSGGAAPPPLAPAPAGVAPPNRGWFGFGRSSAATAAPAEAGSWNCSACTYSNAASARACEVCGTPR